MQTKPGIILVALAVVISSCANKISKNESAATAEKIVTTGTTDIPYTIANNYFVRNDFKREGFAGPRISSPAALDSIFGKAAFMGPRGKVTPIDFSRQYGLTVIGELTDRPTEIAVISLQQKGNSIILTYKIIEGEKSMAITRPMLLILVDNKYQGESILEKK
jgi:hypothetical protein